MSWDPLANMSGRQTIPLPPPMTLPSFPPPEDDFMLRHERLFRVQYKPPQLEPPETKFGEILSYKLFTVNCAIDGTPLLTSPYQGTVWLPQTIAESDTLPSIGELTGGGVYVWKNLLAVRKEEKGDTLAEVFIWGDVVEHLYGYRAQYCRIEAIKDTESDVSLEALQAAYDWQGRHDCSSPSNAR